MWFFKHRYNESYQMKTTKVKYFLISINLYINAGCDVWTPPLTLLMFFTLMRQIKATLWQCAKCFAIEMASSFDSDFYLLRLPRRHSWPEAVQTLRPSTSGIFDPLPDQEEIALRSSMTSRTSNHSMGSCIYLLRKY